MFKKAIATLGLIAVTTSAQAYDVQVKEFEPTNSVIGYSEAQTECYVVFRGMQSIDGMIYHNIRPWPNDSGRLSYSYDLVYPAEKVLRETFDDPFIGINTEFFETNDAIYVSECLDSSKWRSLPRIFKILKSDIHSAQVELDKSRIAIENKSQELVDSFN